MLRHRRLQWITEPRLSSRILRGGALAVALLFLLASLGGQGPAPGYGAGMAEGASAVALDCARHDGDQGRAPPAHCVHCCILCDCAADQIAARLLTVAQILARTEGRASPAPFAAVRIGGLDKRPPGWASSWSSQAPPILS